MSCRNWLCGVVSAAIVVVAVACGRENQKSAADGGDRSNVTLVSTDRTLGSPKAPILMVEYAAPTCPHCAHFNNDIFPLLRSNYIDTGKVYYVFRVFPLNSVDVAAEAMARCLPAKNYFQFLDLLYRNQTKWDPEFGVTDVHGALIQMGRIAGMSAAQVDACIGNQAEAQKIEKVGRDASARYGINGTPSFVTNGQVHSPFEDYQELKDYLDRILAKK